MNKDKFLRSLTNMPHDEAISRCLNYLKNSSDRKLKYSIMNSKSTRQILYIMWNSHLSSSGMHVMKNMRTW